MADYRGHEVDLTPTEAMASNAKRGLAWREEYGSGGTEVGVARARDLANRRELSPETVRRMVSYFARHAVDAEGQGWRGGEEGYPSAGLIAWLLWGGDEGRAWSKRKSAALDRIDEQEGKSMEQSKQIPGEDKEWRKPNLENLVISAKAVGEGIGERQVKVVVSTEMRDRHGDMVVVEGIDLTNYGKNPVVLAQHDHCRPIARCVGIGIKNGVMEATVQFPPEGDDPDADLYYKRIKNGVINTASIGFMVKEWEPLDPESDPSGWNGRRYLRSELLEFSFVSVPAVPDAVIVARSAPGTVRQLLTIAEQIELCAKNLAAQKEQAVEQTMIVRVDADDAAAALRDAGEAIPKQMDAWWAEKRAKDEAIAARKRVAEARIRAARIN